MSDINDLLKRVDANDTQERHRKVIKSMAEEAFRDHVIEEEREGVFMCRRPGTSFYFFRVAFLPGMTVVYGDIGDLMVEGSEEWVSRAVCHDLVNDYFFGRVRPVRNWSHKQFLPGEALKELRAMHDGVPLIEDGIDLVQQAKENGIAVEQTYDWYERIPAPETAIKIAEDWLSWDESGQDGDAWGRAYYQRTSDCEFPDCRDYDSNDLWCYWGLRWFIENRG